jgi:hypothetical protein
MQVASYPYLLLRAARQAQITSAFLRELKEKPGPIDLPLKLRPKPEWRDSQILDRLSVRVTFEDSGSQLEVLPEGVIARGSITERDIVEQAAQIFQYQAEIGSRGNAMGYSRWLREPGRYTLAFGLVARQLGAENAYRMLPVLTRVAFGTTIPLSAFAAAVAQCKMLPADLFDWESRDACGALLLNMLRRRWGTVDPGDVRLSRPEVDDPQGVFPDDSLAALVPLLKKLPTSLLSEADSHAAVDGRVTMSAFLNEPWRHWPRGAGPNGDAGNFLPPGIVIQLFDDAFPSGASVMWVSPLMSQTPFPDVAGGTYADWFRELYRARIATTSMLAPVSAPHPLCPHTGCRFHPTGLCRSWFPVPKSTSDECLFPGWIRVTTGRDVSSDSSQLVPVQTAWTLLSSEDDHGPDNRG